MCTAVSLAWGGDGAWRRGERGRSLGDAGLKTVNKEMWLLDSWTTVGTALAGQTPGSLIKTTMSTNYLNKVNFKISDWELGYGMKQSMN